ncbi:MAG TPA: type III-B CRISPR module-associated Cmr3 family protein [Draconibacterium sp.]|nr:type III-B CRISPR module-associated Cmr3 family protein [Draconibacterium sp.]
MNNKKTYKIDLRPMDVFFFGGEQHFGEGDDANYFVRSNYFPQQSGILGMLRHQLLIQNKCIPITPNNKTEVFGLIGEESYDIQTVKTFGAIQQISPLFISKGTELLFPEAYEFYINKKDSPESLSQIEVATVIGKTIIYPNTESSSVVTVGKEYLGKYDIKELLVSKNEDRFNFSFDKEFEGKGTLPENGVFIETGKPGIQKSARKQKGQKDQGFYKQYSWSFPEGVCFTFFAEIDRDIARNFESGRIMLGGEKSAFHMVVKEFDGEGSPFDENSKFYSGLYERPHSSFHKIVCLSDCIVGDEISAKVAFMSNTMIDFRNSISKVKHTTNYNRMTPVSKNQTYESPTRSEKYQLLKRGSVLWVDDTHLKSVQDLLNKEQHRVIGYNYFKTIQKQ